MCALQWVLKDAPVNQGQLIFLMTRESKWAAMVWLASDGLCSFINQRWVFSSTPGTPAAGSCPPKLRWRQQCAITAAIMYVGAFLGSSHCFSPLANAGSLPLAPFTFGAGWFSVVMFSSIPGCSPPDRYQQHAPSCHNQKCLQTANAPRVGESPLVENHWSNWTNRWEFFWVGGGRDQPEWWRSVNICIFCGKCRIVGKSMDTIWDWIIALPLTAWIDIGELLNPSVLEISVNADNNECLN